MDGSTTWPSSLSSISAAAHLWVLRTYNVTNIFLINACKIRYYRFHLDQWLSESDQDKEHQNAKFIG